MAVGALSSGFLVRRVGIVPLSLAGIGLAAVGLGVMSVAGPATELWVLVTGLALFGVGFGVTVTPRSTAAVEALGRAAYGVASAGVTVARMAGMAIGLAVLTGFGTSRIEALSLVLTDPEARDRVLPEALQGRHDFLTLSFSGQLDRKEQMRSNASGIGVRAALRMQRLLAESQLAVTEVGPSSFPDDPSRCLASLGIYLFNTEFLYERLFSDADDVIFKFERPDDRLGTVASPDCAVVGIRPGEKLHEEMISSEDARRTIRQEDRYVVGPTLAEWTYRTPPGDPVPEGFEYTSDTNDLWLTVADLRDMLAAEL